MVCRYCLICSLVALMSLSSGCTTKTNRQEDEDPWKHAASIVDRINLPEIPSQTFLLSDFGGVGDGVTNNKTAFDQVISRVAESGGGRIVVESGTYLINGPIHLGSFTNLHIEEGARLVFGNDPVYYLPMVLTSWEGTRAYNYSPFISCG